MDRFESHPVLKTKINKFIPLLTIPVIASQINKSSKQKCSIREILISCKHPLFKGAVSELSKTHGSLRNNLGKVQFTLSVRKR